MKILALGLAILAHSFIIATSSSAQNVGLNLKAMPVGTKIFRAYSNGEKRELTFLGKKRRYYEFSVKIAGRSSGNFTALQKFDAQGRFVRWTGAGFYKEKFNPYNCEFALGSCTHKLSADYGNGGYTWIFNNTLSGNTLTSHRRRKNEPEFRIPMISKLGKYNIRMSQEIRRNGKVVWSSKVTKIVEPK